MTDTRRVEPRYAAYITTEILHEGALHHGALHDVSLSGGFIETELALDSGAQLTIQFKDGYESKGLVFLHYSLSAKVVAKGVGVHGYGFTWDPKSANEKALVARLIADVRDRKLPTLSIEARNSRLWGIVVALSLIAYTACVVFGLDVWRSEVLAPYEAWRWKLGIVGSVLLASSLAIAVRRRGLIGTRGRGAYGQWLAFHVLVTLLGLACLVLHVAERRGTGVPFLSAILVATLPATALPRLWAWKRMPKSRFAKYITRNWLKVHVALIGPLVVAIGWHVVQVVMF